MQSLQAFKFELMPDGAQARSLRRFAGLCRFVFNKALALQKERYACGEKKLGYGDLCKIITTWRNSVEISWLAQSPIHPLQQTLKDLEKAYTNFFAKRAAFPKFKRRGEHDAFRYPDPKQFELDQGNARIKLPKLGWVRYRKSREVLGAPKNVTVSQSCGRWFVSVQTERDVAVPVHAAIIGVDVGVTRFATMSDGEFIAPLSSFKRHEDRLKRYQRAMSRKVKFSANWKKAKAKVQRVHRDIGNCRRDFLHKSTTALVKDHALICIENLQVRNMSKSAAGSVDAPGRNVRQKAGLNKAILDQGWGEFRRQLEYKSAWAGTMIVAVPAHHTSQTCPCCGHVSSDNRTTQARSACVSCGYENNADVVGAINVLERGQRLLACGELVQLGRSVKQEPTEATRRTPRSAVGIPVLYSGEDVNGASYVRQETRQIYAVETATVVSVRAVMIEPRADHLGLGAAVGNRIGGGNGRTAATVLTALLGGAVGQRVDHDMSSVRGVEVTYSLGTKTFAIVQQDDGTRFVLGESVRIVTGAGWNATSRVAKL